MGLSDSAWGEVKRTQMWAFGGSVLEEFVPKKIPINFSEYSETSSNGERHIQLTISHTLKTRNVKIYFVKTRSDQRGSSAFPSITVTHLGISRRGSMCGRQVQCVMNVEVLNSDSCLPHDLGQSV